MVTIHDAIALARAVDKADKVAREMADHRRHPDFFQLREAAQQAREFLRNAGHG